MDAARCGQTINFAPGLCFYWLAYLHVDVVTSGQTGTGLRTAFVFCFFVPENGPRHGMAVRRILVVVPVAQGQPLPRWAA